MMSSKETGTLIYKRQGQAMWVILRKVNQTAKETLDADDSWCERGLVYHGKPPIMGNSTERESITYPNGDVYTGEFKDNQKHGTGLYRYANGGTTYEGGYLKDGQRRERNIPVQQLF
jgi:hypothetical protein